MRKVIPTAFLIGSALLSSGQSQNWWRVNGNTPSSGDYIGTSNSTDLIFKTNNTIRLTIDATGNLKASTFVGSGNRFLQADPNGNLIPFASGTATQVLYGNGTWGALPLGATSWNVVSDNMIFNTGNLGIGTSNPQYKLDVNGSAKVANNFIVDGNVNANGSTTLNGGLKLSSFVGNGGDLSVDNSGNVILNPHIPVISCVPGSPQWSMSGDNFVPYSTLQGLFNEASIGTCNNFDFILKSNAVNRAWFKTDGTVSFGANIASNTGGPEYKFHQGAMRLSGFNTYGGPMVVFDGGMSTYGDWGIEYAPSQFAKPGLNFWKPFGSANANNYLFFLADDGMVGVGTDNPTSRLTIDAWSNDGLKIFSDPNKNAFDIKEKNTGNLNYRVKSSGSTLINLTGNYTDDALVIKNNANTNESFKVQSNGYTEIKVLSPNNMPAPYGGEARVFTIRDIPNNKDLFTITKSGKVYGREVEINLSQNFPDYVFESNYKLKSLVEVEQFIKQNKHLPNFEKGTYYEKNGINVSDLLIKQQQTIEELMLYNIELEKKNQEIENQITEVLNRLKVLEEKK